MLLAIDVGNTNTVFALYDGETPLADWRIATDTRRTADEYFVWLNHLMTLSDYDTADVTDAIIATVAPQTLFNLKTLARKYFSSEPLVIGEEGCDVGMEIRLSRPSEIGADRIVNARAARSSYGNNLVILDFGTATTFDVVDESGAYAGGAIAPGVNLSLAALHQAAAKLPRVAVDRPARVIGTDTVSAMQSGVYWGYIGLIEGLSRRIIADHGAEMKVIATGGLSPLFAAGTEIIYAVDDSLTMRGLVEIHALNRGERRRET
ncbi:UNVERIFIED_CONTAM: hypothetical protein GTU68_056790 [Idotea baltica]|nr:hypothetical protein [Idotea baltica]